MARPRAFDTDAALDGAMDVFWTQGYENASLPDLLTGMGITRGSLYKAFTDKKSLFLLILERYEHAAVNPAVEVLTDPGMPDGFDRIARLFASVLGQVQGGDRRGCLLCTAAAGPAMDDAEISRAVGVLMAKMRDGFVRALDDAGMRSADLAEMLLTQYVGLRILTRSQAPLEIIERSVAAMMKTLRSALDQLTDADGG